MSLMTYQMHITGRTMKTRAAMELLDRRLRDFFLWRRTSWLHPIMRPIWNHFNRRRLFNNQLSTSKTQMHGSVPCIRKIIIKIAWLEQRHCRQKPQRIQNQMLKFNRSSKLGVTNPATEKRQKEQRRSKDHSCRINGDDVNTSSATSRRHSCLQRRNKEDIDAVREHSFYIEKI